MANTVAILLWQRGVFDISMCNSKYQDTNDILQYLFVKQFFIGSHHDLSTMVSARNIFYVWYHHPFLLAWPASLVIFAMTCFKAPFAMTCLKIIFDMTCVNAIFAMTYLNVIFATTCLNVLFAMICLVVPFAITKHKVSFNWMELKVHEIMATTKQLFSTLLTMPECFQAEFGCIIE